MSKKKSTTSNKLFATDLDFCPQCGTVLPLPGLKDVVTCKLCGFQIDVLDFDGIEIHTKLEVNKPQSFLSGQEEADTELTGPKADRKCQKCGHDEMIYTTRQTRSADEGQTVFFTCPICRANLYIECAINRSAVVKCSDLEQVYLRFQEIEYS